MPSEKSRYVFKKSHYTPSIDNDSKDKEIIFNSLKQVNNSELISILESAYEEMNSKQRRNVFEKRLRKIAIESLKGEALIAGINSFISDSKNRMYYAPFEINYKNCSHVPEATEEWFSRVADFLIYASQLAKNEDYQNTVIAFKLIYGLIDLMESGYDIVFADELGTWMLPVDEAECMYYNILSISKIYVGLEFSNEIISLIQRDRIQSFTLKVYETALKIADIEQKNYLNDEIKRQNIRIK